MSQFHLFSGAVKAQFDRMSGGELHVVDATDLWESYLGAFPEGTNPIFRVRTEHDCSCCRSFVHHVGHVVRLTDDGVETVWGSDTDLPEPYRQVMQRMDAIVRQLPVVGVWRTKQPKYGAEVTRESTDTGTISWNHFHCEVARSHRSDSPQEDAGKINTGAQVMARSLRELSLDAVNTVLELIGEGSLYRGEEHLRAVRQFADVKRAYDDLDTESARSAHAWRHASKHGSGFRNTAIGTLVSDLSEGVDLERAVKSFESKVAPHNYKRPTALITQRMIDDALGTLRGLGLETAVQRRHARLPDVSVRDVLWTDGSVRSVMLDGLDSLMAGAAKRSASARAGGSPEIGIDEFLREVVPSSRSLSVLLENRHLPNFVSVTAPVDPEAPPLFQWPSGCAWSYDGDAADSVREKVKRAGGDVDAPLRVSLAWYNFDDLDLHSNGPDGHVFYASPSGSGHSRILDVDMNAGGPKSREAVENQSWRQPKDGKYRVWVNQFNRRESVDTGFEIQLWDGVQTRSWRYEGSVLADVRCLEFHWVRGQVKDVVVNPKLIGGSAPQEKWGVRTGDEVPVDVLMHSPNHWGESSTGARHTIFALRGCLAPEPVRGIYNEFLRPDLSKHRKVMEVLGSRSRAPYSAEQISGVGFTAGRGDSVKVRSKGEGHDRVFEVKF